ncbi:hypothetical protein Ssi03_48770 [Sphaerisporangium siamense]|nr:hypothetical protein Ssi03_48770 [Sphaerisporangium siamense]
MAAGVHGGPARAVGEAGLFGEGQGVELGAEQHGGTRPVGEHAYHTVPANGPENLEAFRAEPGGKGVGRAVLLPGKLGILVDILIQIHQNPDISG